MRCPDPGGTYQSVLIIQGMVTCEGVHMQLHKFSFTYLNRIKENYPDCSKHGIAHSITHNSREINRDLVKRRACIVYAL